ncbi:MAG TPA: hypothetical protein VK416_04460 [Thermoanaerobaculia bacterium]|nr:hypothetical protein [Thermoanaerobaculia bacterium]
MVPVMSLWLPILLSAVIVFVASSIIHMMLPYHKNDFRKLPNEDGVMDALRRLGVPPADYCFPKPDSAKAMKDPAFREKWSKGPVGLMTVFPSGPPSMAKNLVQWFLYCVVVGIFAAYIAGRALQPGAPYLPVFRFAGCTAFIGYSLALWQNTIWYKRAWTTTLKTNIDGLIYALLTAGTFGWLWPK